MKLILIDNKNNKIDERFSRRYHAEKDLEKNIKFCNYAIQELIDPINYNNTRIKVNKTMKDYYKVMELAYLLRSPETRKLFKAIKKDRYQKQVFILNNMSMIKLKRLLNKPYNILTLINTIQALLKEMKKQNKQIKKSLMIINN